jgi:acetyl esterase/lipase
MSEMDFREVFGKEYVGSIDALRRYRAKALGCRIVANGYRLPPNFPNPIRDIDVSVLQLSIFRVQPFLHVKNYRSDMMERVLGNGTLSQTSVDHTWS